MVARDPQKSTTRAGRNSMGLPRGCGSSFGRVEKRRRRAYGELVRLKRAAYNRATDPASPPNHNSPLSRVAMAPSARIVRQTSPAPPVGSDVRCDQQKMDSQFCQTGEEADGPRPKCTDCRIARSLL